MYIIFFLLLFLLISTQYYQQQQFLFVSAQPKNATTTTKQKIPSNQTAIVVPTTAFPFPKRHKSSGSRTITSIYIPPPKMVERNKLLSTTLTVTTILAAVVTPTIPAAAMIFSRQHAIARTFGRDDSTCGGPTRYDPFDKVEDPLQLDLNPEKCWGQLTGIFLGNVILSVGIPCGIWLILATIRAVKTRRLPGIYDGFDSGWTLQVVAIACYGMFLPPAVSAILVSAVRCGFGLGGVLSAVSYLSFSFFLYFFVFHRNRYESFYSKKYKVSRRKQSFFRTKRLILWFLAPSGVWEWRMTEKKIETIWKKLKLKEGENHIPDPDIDIDGEVMMVVEADEDIVLSNNNNIDEVADSDLDEPHKNSKKHSPQKKNKKNKDKDKNEPGTPNSEIDALMELANEMRREREKKEQEKSQGQQQEEILPNNNNRNIPDDDIQKIMNDQHINRKNNNKTPDLSDPEFQNHLQHAQLRYNIIQRMLGDKYVAKSWWFLCFEIAIRGLMTIGPSIAEAVDPSISCLILRVIYLLCINCLLIAIIGRRPYTHRALFIANVIVTFIEDVVVVLLIIIVAGDGRARLEQAARLLLTITSIVALFLFVGIELHEFVLEPCFKWAKRKVIYSDEEDDDEDESNEKSAKKSDRKRKKHLGKSRGKKDGDEDQPRDDDEDDLPDLISSIEQLSSLSPKQKRELQNSKIGISLEQWEKYEEEVKMRKKLLRKIEKREKRKNKNKNKNDNKNKDNRGEISSEDSNSNSSDEDENDRDENENDDADEQNLDDKFTQLDKKLRRAFAELLATDVELVPKHQKYQAAKIEFEEMLNL